MNNPGGEQSGGWTIRGVNNPGGELSGGWTIRGVNYPGGESSGGETSGGWIVLDPFKYIKYIFIVYLFILSNKVFQCSLSHTQSGKNWQVQDKKKKQKLAKLTTKKWQKKFKLMSEKQKSVTRDASSEHTNSASFQIETSEII